MELVLRGRPRFSGLSVLVVVASLVLICVSGASADFNIAEDSFCISNAPGYCFAMAAFSRWYYLNRPEDLPLRKALDKKVQTQIAGQLQEFYAKNLIKLQADYCGIGTPGQGPSVRQILLCQ